MSEPDFIIEPAEQVFRMPASSTQTAVMASVGGIALLVLAVAGFCLAIVIRANVVTQQVLTTLPALAGIGALATATMIRRTPREVGVSDAGLRIDTRQQSRTHPWSEIGWSMIDAPLGPRRVLRVFDVEGRVLVSLSESIERFDALAEALTGRIAAKRDDTAERVQRTQARRRAVWLGLGGVLFLAVSISLAWMTSREIRAERLLKTAAVPGKAQIERRFLAPNGVTPRLVYRITTKDGKSASRNAEVLRPMWDALEGAETVDVIYVPGEPEISRLAAGEAPDRDASTQPLVGYGVPVLGGLFSLFFLGAAVLAWRGLDIDLDSKTGKLSIKRFGTGR
ncbi:MAG: hypothetical protein ACK47B_05075 [Armatimonadota bacterium]